MTKTANEYIGKLSFRIADADGDDGPTGSKTDSDIFVLEEIEDWATAGREPKAYTVRVDYFATSFEVSCTDNTTDQDVPCPEEVLKTIFTELWGDPILAELYNGHDWRTFPVIDTTER